MIEYPVSPDVSTSPLPFSPATKVGNLIFVSGQASTNEKGEIVSDTFEQKMEACHAYQSQGLGPEGELTKYVRDIHAYFGGRIGAEYAEPFYSDELIGLSGLDELM